MNRVKVLLCVSIFTSSGLLAMNNPETSDSVPQGITLRNIPKKRTYEEMAYLESSSSDTSLDESTVVEETGYTLCSVCNKKIRSDYHYDHHYKCHGRGSEIVSCHFPDCTTQVVKYKLNCHINIKHGPRAQKMRCDFPTCNAMIAAYLMTQHKKIHYPGFNKKNVTFFACKQCNHELISLGGMINHLKKTHFYLLPGAVIIQKNPLTVDD